MHSFTESNPLKIAIVGSGPSGFYAAETLLKSDVPVEVSMFERLPSPFGLVRSGVAPDHQGLKKVIKVFSRIAEDARFHLFANVSIGDDLNVTELKQLFHAIIFCNGAQTDRRLGIPGEDISGSYTATEFVAWYNGHPDYRDREFDLSHETAAIIGQGNVAADVARILAKSTDELKQTDIAEHALECLAESKVKYIHVIGRRGPAQAKFTSKEVKEFKALAIATPTIEPAELILNPASQIELEAQNNAGNKKVFEILQSFSEQPSNPEKTRQIIFTFLKSPIELIGDQKLEKLILEQNELSGEAMTQSAKGTGKKMELNCGILFRSIGYRGVAISDVPFDEKRGVIPNVDGRIKDNDSVLQQLYVSGWIKRGPTGIIGTNRADSVATVQSLLADIEILAALDPRDGAEVASRMLSERGIRYVSFDDWKKIDHAEIERGQPKGKPREKYTRVGEMLELLD